MFVVFPNGDLAENFEDSEAMEKRTLDGFVDVRLSNDFAFEPVYVYVGEVGGVNWR